MSKNQRRMFAWLAVAFAGNVGMFVARSVECNIAWFVALGVWAVCITVSIINLIKFIREL